MSEYSKELYHKRKALHLCPTCTVALPPDSTRVVCEKCRKMQCERYKVYSQTHSDQVKMSQKERYETKKAMGLCVLCGSLAIQGKTICRKCSYALSEKHRKKQEKTV